MSMGAFAMILLENALLPDEGFQILEKPKNDAEPKG